jgi:hypothetical protein
MRSASSEKGLRFKSGTQLSWFAQPNNGVSHQGAEMYYLLAANLVLGYYLPRALDFAKAGEQILMLQRNV